MRTVAMSLVLSSVALLPVLRRVPSLRPQSLLLLLLLGVARWGQALGSEVVGAPSARFLDDGQTADRQLMGGFFRKESGVEHASVEIEYGELEHLSAPMSMWFNAIEPLHTGSETYFSVLGHSTGYSGLEQASGLWGYQGRAVFSVLEAGCGHLKHEWECPEHLRAKVIECGEYSYCMRFSGGGTGVYASLNFNYGAAGTTYGFVTVAQRIGRNHMQYDGFIHVPELGGWMLLAKIQAPIIDGTWYLSGLRSFVEPFTGKDRGVDRMAILGPSFVHASSGAWIQLTQATSFQSQHHEDDREHAVAEVVGQGKLWGIGIGGTHDEALEVSGRVLTVNASDCPESLQLFDSLRQAGQLPFGCKAGTCPLSVANNWLYGHLFLIGFVILPLSVVACCGIAFRIQPKFFQKRRQSHPPNFLTR